MHADLTHIARRVKWWQPPDETLADETDFLCRVMAMASLDDARTVLAVFGPHRLSAALRGAPPGVLDARSWHYWHLRLGLGPAGPMPSRRLA